MVLEEEEEVRPSAEAFSLRSTSSAVIVCCSSSFSCSFSSTALSSCKKLERAPISTAKSGTVDVSLDDGGDFHEGGLKSHLLSCLLHRRDLCSETCVLLRGVVDLLLQVYPGAVEDTLLVMHLLPCAACGGVSLRSSGVGGGDEMNRRMERDR